MKILLTSAFFFFTVILLGQTNKTKEDCLTQFDSISSRNIYILVDSMPEYPGGIDSMKIFIRENLQWPNTGIDFEGSVYVSFIVESDGSITNKKVIRGIEQSVNEEALKVIDKMPKWKAGICKGERVPVKYTIPVTYRLN